MNTKGKRRAANLPVERKHTSSMSSAGLPKRRAVDTYPCDALWLGPSWPCMSLDRYTQSTLNVARHAKKSEVEGEIESQIESQEVQEGQASGAAQAAEGCCQHSGAGGCCNGSGRLRSQARSRRQRSQKAPRSNVVLTQMRQGRRWRSSRPLQRRQSAMPLKVRLRSRRQTTGLQSSTRLLKRPGERPRVAKPQPSEQGLPPRRWRLLQRKQPTSPPSTKPPQRS